MRRILPTLLLIANAFAIISIPCNAKKENCNSSSCGNLHQIRYPFRLQTDPPNCGPLQLACESNQTILHLYSMSLYVNEIFYDDKMIQLVDSGLSSSNCSMLPRYSIDGGEPNISPFRLPEHNKSIVFVSCPFHVKSPSYIPLTPCFNTSPPYLYVLAGSATVADLRDSCNVELAIPAPSSEVDNRSYDSYHEIHRLLLMGFNLSWEEPCHSFHCHFVDVSEFIQALSSKLIKAVDSNSDPYQLLQTNLWVEMFGWVMIVRSSIGILLMSVFLMYKLHIGLSSMSMDDNIEEFLSKYKNQTPTRYTYSDIRKMTNNFKEKLGQGGFGSVFKGNLPNDSPIAVKMLGKSKGGGRDFINEVATIGRIHHFNVVQLVGFCSERSKRALIYEFMSKGSLEKYIFSQEGEANQLSWEKIYEIALGIARGIEYLHRGCDMRILHFDIKPHNILLDDDFTPKVSDFGLAKLYPADNSIVSVTAVRGTLGYIAPELFYRSLGSISHKSDVYSFGMLLMEMAGRRKNFDAYAKNSSQNYFPLWIYDQLDRGDDVEITDATEDEKEIAKRLITVALWCIQMKPTERPSMNEVVQMLENSSTPLQWPARPFICPPDEKSGEDHEIQSDSTESTTVCLLQSPSHQTGT